RLRISLPYRRRKGKKHVLATGGIHATHLVGLEHGRALKRPSESPMTTHSGDRVIRWEGNVFRERRERGPLPATDLGDLLRDRLVAETQTLQAQHFTLEPPGA